MKHRTYHYLSRTKGFRYPARYLSLGCALGPQATVYDAGNKRTMEAFAWHVLEISDCAKAGSISRTRRGMEPGRFLPALAGLLGTAGLVDLWSWSTVATMGALGLWQAIENGAWVLQDEHWKGMAMLTDPPTIIIVRPRSSKAAVRILDLRNLGLETLAELRDATQADAQCRPDWWAATIDADVAAHVQAGAISEYVDRWMETLSEEKLGAFKPTLASQAACAFRHRFMRCPILVHADKPTLGMEQDSLYPGRTECYQLGRVTGPVYELDFQSYYPAICLERRFPARRRKLMTGNEDVYQQIKAGNMSWIADVEIDTNKPIYPLRRKDDVIWPIGHFMTTLAGPELTHAIEHGHAQTIRRAACYDSEPLLHQWCRWALDFRAKSKDREDKVGERIAKQMTNSLWGRFAQRVKRWVNDADVITKNPWDDWFEKERETAITTHCRSIGWLGQRYVVGGYSHDACPAITAFIVSAGRIMLWNIMQAVRSGRILYCATDSLFVDERGYDELLNAGAVGYEQPGRLKLVAVHDWVTFRGIHDYTTPNSSTVAGKPLGATGSAEMGWSWSSYEKPQGSLKRKERPGPNLVPHTRAATGVYTHGTVRGDGSVKPFRFIDGRIADEMGNH